MPQNKAQDKFLNDKKCFLSKIDKSMKGSIDEAVKPLIEAINKNKNYYTTSSCAGRILVMENSGKKYEANRIFVSHDEVSYNQLQDALKTLPATAKGEIWFKEEGIIIHVNCRTLAAATKLLNIARELGLKRSGIISNHPETGKIVVEILNTDKLDCPIANNGKLLVSEEYLQYLLNTANEKLRKNRIKINEFCEKMTKYINKKVL